jgi:diaminohydroxyphosphoribosylaminopyrimidine deaminase / 5-amino-6-(5-phosphoribosylamino)uracil reductase
VSARRAAGLSPLDLHLLERTLELAERGRPGARPNPVVGAVLALPDGTILAEGFHERHGGPHAERAALRRVVSPVPEQATLYVSLEPCAHHGRQPPCTEALLAWGVRRVVIAAADDNPETSGLGPQELAREGVQVEWGPQGLADRAAQQNAGFHTLHRHGRPYVTYKWAMTRNGRVSTGNPDEPWISSPASRELVQYLRAGSGAVAVGIGTVLADDPLLTVRGPIAARLGAPPLRVIYDRTLRLPLTSRLVATLEQAPVLVCCGPSAPVEREQALAAAGVQVWRAPSDTQVLEGSFRELGRRSVGDVLVESGPVLAAALHQQGLIDALVCFQSQADAPTDQPGFDAGHPLLAAIADTPPTRCGSDTMRTRILHAVTARPATA